MTYAYFKFGKSQFHHIVRKKQFNEVDFLSFIGGLLGLFAGFSALSFVEIIFWILIRVRGVISKRSNSAVHPKVIEVAECVREGNGNNLDQISNSLNGENFEQKNVAQEYFSESSIHGLNYIFSYSYSET